LFAKNRGTGEQADLCQNAFQACSYSIHNASQRIVFRDPFRFVPQHLLNLVVIRDKEGAIQAARKRGKH